MCNIRANREYVVFFIIKTVIGIMKIYWALATGYISGIRANFNKITIRPILVRSYIPQIEENQYGGT